MFPDQLKKMIRNHLKKMRKIIGLFLFPFVFLACGNDSVFNQFQSVKETGWYKDSMVVFNVEIADTAQHYNVLLNVRNGGEYPYQNLWLFINRIGPDSVVLNDTVECYLADQRGKWKGSGIGSVYEISVLYLQNTTFSKSGNYIYKIRQGMREDRLKGISDIGLMVEKQ
jgi:gliding motility-associated lipoprotein GldH